MTSTLSVHWADPATEADVHIGTLTDTGDSYRFQYTGDAASTPGFRPLLGLPDLARTYTAAELFPLFQERVMHPRRPEYVEHLTGHGRTPREIAWFYLVFQEGRREGDTLSLRAAGK